MIIADTIKKLDRCQVSIVSVLFPMNNSKSFNLLHFKSNIFEHIPNNEIDAHVEASTKGSTNSLVITRNDALQ